MRPLSHPHHLGLILALAGCVQLISCTSGPSFEGMSRAEDAPSFQEALWECGRYEMPVPSDQPSDFRPYLDCTESAADRPMRALRGRFGVFAEEIRDRYRSVNRLSWTPALAQEVEVAARALLRHFWQSPGAERRMTEREKRLSARHFPKSFEVLGASSWRASGPHPPEPRLELLRARVAALEERGTPVPELCTRLRQLRAEQTGLAELYRDLAGIAELSAPAPSVIGKAQWERYLSRVNQALQDSESLRESMARGTPAEGAGERDSVNPVPPLLIGACPPRSPDA